MSWAGGLFIAVILAGPTIGRIEGYYFPAADILRVERVEIRRGPTVYVWGTLNRIRPRCSWVATHWYLSDGVHAVEIPIRFMEGAVIRPPGVSNFGPWRLSFTPLSRDENYPNEILRGTYAQVIHRCPWHPWYVTTHIYP